VVPQGGALIISPEYAALLEEWNDMVDERIESAGCDVRDQDESVAGIGLNELVDGLGDRFW
jgi:hypothetical protein